MSIKPHQNCTEGRHVFIPTRWEEDVKIQQRWVTEFSCQHCLHYVGSEEWSNHLNVNKATIEESIDELVKYQEGRITRETLDNICGAAEYIPLGTPIQSAPPVDIRIPVEILKTEKKRGRPFAKSKA